VLFLLLLLLLLAVFARLLELLAPRAGFGSTAACDVAAALFCVLLPARLPEASLVRPACAGCVPLVVCLLMHHLRKALCSIMWVMYNGAATDPNRHRALYTTKPGQLQQGTTHNTSDRSQ